MQSRFDYRIAVPADVAACIEIRGMTRENAISAERLASMGITEASWSESVREGALPGVVCTAEEGIIGYCFGDRDTGEIVVLALLPRHEDKGIGRVLLSRVCDVLSGHGHRRLFLGCSADPASRSFGFYRHLGWRSTGTFDDNEDEILEFFPASNGEA